MSIIPNGHQISALEGKFTYLTQTQSVLSLLPVLHQTYQFTEFSCLTSLVSSLRLLRPISPPLKVKVGGVRPPQAARSWSLLRDISWASFPKSKCDVYALENKAIARCMVYTHYIVTKHEGFPGRLSVQGYDSIDLEQWGPYKKTARADILAVWSQSQLG